MSGRQSIRKQISEASHASWRIWTLPTGKGKEWADFKPHGPLKQFTVKIILGRWIEVVVKYEMERMTKRPLSLERLGLLTQWRQGNGDPK